MQPQSKHDEHILVVKRADIIQEPWHGLKQESLEMYVAAVRAKGEFLPRSEMEINTAYKQIIPYLIFTYNNTYFLMQRKSNASETRLQNKFSLGIGGHIRQDDVQGTDIFAWAQREFHEEVHCTGSLIIEPLGIIILEQPIVKRQLAVDIRHRAVRVVSIELRSGSRLDLVINIVVPFFNRAFERRENLHQVLRQSGVSIRQGDQRQDVLGDLFPVRFPLRIRWRP